MDVVRGGAPSPIIVEGQDWPQQTVYHWKVRLILDMDKISWFHDLMSNFRKIVKFRPLFEVRKKFKLLKSRHVAYQFEVRDWKIRIISLFHEIFKYRENINNNRFREIYKSFLKISKFEYFANRLYIRNLQITCFKMTYYLFMSHEFDIFSTCRKWPKFLQFLENCS